MCIKSSNRSILNSSSFADKSFVAETLNHYAKSQYNTASMQLDYILQICILVISSD